MQCDRPRTRCEVRLEKFNPSDIAVIVKGKVDCCAGQHSKLGGILTSVALEFVEGATEDLVRRGVGKVAKRDWADTEDLAQTNGFGGGFLDVGF